MVLTSLELKDKTFGTKFRGYDADEVKANEKAYEKLDGCCKI